MADGSTSSIAAAQLRSFVERIEKLEAEKSELGADIREVYAEAKGNGFDAKMIRHIVRLRRMEESDRREHIATRDTYEESVFG